MFKIIDIIKVNDFKAINGKVGDVIAFLKEATGNVQGNRMAHRGRFGSELVNKVHFSLS